MSFAEAIKRLRADRGWKQAELARRTGFPQGTIAKFETGRVDNPTQDTLIKLAAAFEISVPELLREAGIAMRVRPDLAPSIAELADLGVPPEELAELAAIWGDLPAEDRQIMLTTMRAMQERHNRRAPKHAPQQAHGPKPALG